MIKKITSIILMNTILLTSLTGCWDYVSLKDITIVAGLGIDWIEEKDEFILTAEIVSMPMDKNETMKTRMVEAKGDTFLNTFQTMIAKVSGEVYLNQCQIIIIGEEAAKHRLQHIIETVLRTQRFEEIVEILVAKELKASDVFQVKSLDGIILSLGIKELFESSSQPLSSLRIINFQTSNMLKTNTKSPVLRTISVVKQGKEKLAQASGVAFFKEGKLAGYLDAEETNYFLLAANLTSQGTLKNTVKLNAAKYATARVAKNKASTRVKIKDDGIDAVIKIHTTVTANELKDVNYNLDTIHDINKLETDFKQDLINGILHVVNKVKNEHGSDILGFGKLIENQDPRKWKSVKEDWEDVLKDIDVTVDARVTLHDTFWLHYKK